MLLDELTKFESVQFILIFGVGAIAVVAMGMRATNKIFMRKSEDQRLVNEQQIDMTYTKQMQISHSKDAEDVPTVKKR